VQTPIDIDLHDDGDDNHLSPFWQFSFTKLQWRWQFNNSASGRDSFCSGLFIYFGERTRKLIHQNNFLSGNERDFFYRRFL